MKNGRKERDKRSNKGVFYLYIRSRAYTCVSSDPTYKTFPAIVGDEYTSPPVLYDHLHTPVAASRAYTFPSKEPTYTVPWLTSGDEKT